MGEFEQSGWRRSEYAKGYRDEADHYLQERPALLGIVASFYRHFVTGDGPKRVLDLGCGDGVVAETLCLEDPRAEVTVTDGSNDMLEAARKRLSGRPVAEFCQVTFQGILAGQFRREPFDFIASSFAIHHLDLDQKADFFRSLIELLKPGACFLNVDVAVSEYDAHTEWYFSLWREWIAERRAGLDPGAPSFEHIVDEARYKPENHFDPLEDQLRALRSAGFAEVACHYKRGLFCVYGGRRPER